MDSVGDFLSTVGPFFGLAHIAITVTLWWKNENKARKIRRLECERALLLTALPNDVEFISESKSMGGFRVGIERKDKTSE